MPTPPTSHCSRVQRAQARPLGHVGITGHEGTTRHPVCLIINLHGRSPTKSRDLRITGGADDGTAAFDATSLEFSCPMDLAATAAWAASCAASGVDTRFRQPSDDKAASYARRMDLHQHLEHAGVRIDGTTRRSQHRNNRTDSLIEVTAITGSADLEAFVDRTFTLVEKRIGNREARANHVMIGELLENAITHAESPVGAYAAAQVYPTKKRIEVGIADAGVGIRAHLRRNPSNKAIKDDIAAIGRAVEEGVTGVTDAPPGERGRGFTNLLEIASQHGATLVMRSGSARATVTARPNRPTNTYAAGTHAQVPGTWASLAVTFRHPTT